MDRMIAWYLVVGFVVALGVNQRCAAESEILPWMNKPATVLQEGDMSSDFPRVSGLDELAIATTPAWDRTDASATWMYFEQSHYAQLPQLIKDDPAFAAGWDRLVKLVQTMMADEGLGGLKDVEPQRYVYKLGGRLLNVALYYRMTGDPQAGRFLKAITLDTARRPMDFWLHKALRKYPADFPYGQLETAILGRGMSVAMVWGHDLFDASEREMIQTALRQKGLYPMLRYLQTIKRHNNFLPAIASGALCAAIALDDSLAKKHALDLLNQWGTLVEDDGSYGEQIDYFNYAFVNFAKGQLALGAKHVTSLCETLPQLKGTLPWQLSHYSLDDRGYAVRLNFGDDDFHGGAPSRLTTQLLALMTGNGLGTWMLEHLHGNVPTDDAYAMIAKIALVGQIMPDAVSPEYLPKVAGYDTGIGVIRSGWTLNRDTAIAIRSGAGSRTRYSHDAPNRNSLAMMFHGEYQLVEPGRASYRSPMRRSYDLITKHHNTVSIGQSVQPRDRKAQLLAAGTVGNVDVLVSEAAQSYRQKPKHARRSVYYLRDLDLIVVWDVVQLASPESVSINWHYGNDEGQSTLTQQGSEGWQLLKPRTQLDSWVFADVPLVATQREGIMHLDYSYFPSDKNEGQWGNAFELESATATPVESLSAVSVFAPQVRSQAEPVSVEKSVMQNGITQLMIRHGKQSVSIELNSTGVSDLSIKAAVIGDVVLNADGQKWAQ
ncbi:MAG TPA: hypothetical protein DCM28_05385 [Phycisphaerales bacterium]|nr:hypothetical protein [Phycisphaerales bacterium]HCD33456.1 hypothetical protein [Phycisphaerales bacterium]|tara:strand:- start:52698 stop:54845 length:2148 start_codon:yes stop_codon:yes gene_type:complete